MRGNFDRRTFCRTLGAGLAAAWSRSATAEELRDGVLYPKRISPPAGKFSWFQAVIEQVPPLKHARGSRWPMITWEGFSNAPQEPAYYRQLLDRGPAQHIRFNPKSIETALAIQRAGSPVIVMEGASGTYPAQLAGEPAIWAHQFDDGYKPKDYTRPCPSIHLGWAKYAENLRETLRQFKARGVQIDAVWLDCENDPLYGDDRYDQAKHCKRCRELLPRRVLDSRHEFMEYTARKFYDLFGAYYAAPVLEFFPRCSVTNWLAQPSTPDDPQPGWADNRGRVHMPPLVTAWNPTPYGAASWVWKGKPKELKRNQEHVDQVYTNLLLRQVSLTGRLGARWASEKESIPWIARWVSEPLELEYPVMSRERYREVLRHLWLRGVSAMQVFSPRIPHYEDMALPEVQDAVVAYDEMLAFREILDRGDVLTFDVPSAQDDGIVWSGMRLGDRAVVRTFKQGGGRQKHSVRPWGPTEKAFELEASATGQTSLLEKDGRMRSVSG